MAGVVLSSLSLERTKSGEEKPWPSKECPCSGWVGGAVDEVWWKGHKEGLGEKPWKDTRMELGVTVGKRLGRAHPEAGRGGSKGLFRGKKNLA